MSVEMGVEMGWKEREREREREREEERATLKQVTDGFCCGPQAPRWASAPAGSTPADRSASRACWPPSGSCAARPTPPPSSATPAPATSPTSRCLCNRQPPAPPPPTTTTTNTFLNVDTEVRGREDAIRGLVSNMLEPIWFSDLKAPSKTSSYVPLPVFYRFFFFLVFVLWQNQTWNNSNMNS